MLIALTGLHAAGKSYFANNIPVKFGFKVYNKKDIINFICKQETNRDDYMVWYREEFNKDPINITMKILSCIDLKNDIVLDSVHSDLEWKIITKLVPSSELIGIITPEFIRKNGQDIGDTEKDKSRITYWHNGGGCLMSELSWTLNGGVSLEINEIMFKEFLQYIHKKQLFVDSQQTDFMDSKNKRLENLIEECKEMDNNINNAKRLLKQYEKLCPLERIEDEK